MKKSRHRAGLLATGLVCLSGAAAAQSSVTVYGIIDATAGRFKGSVTGVKSSDKAVYSLIDGAMSTSRIGFMGSEDLGGGLLAIFDLSSFIRVDTGEYGRSNAIGAPVNVAADPFWARAAWVGLTSKSLGRLRLGNISTPMWISSITSNAFGDSTALSPLNLVMFVGSPLSGGTGWTNHVSYDTPDFGGFVATGSVAASENQGGRNASVRASYRSGPIGASLAYQTVKKNPLTFAGGTSPNNTKAWLLAGSYDFGVAKVFAHLGRIRNDGTEAAPLSVTYKIWDLSAAVPVGAGSVLVGYAARTTGDAVGPVPATAAGGNKERKVFTLGYDHGLSKRTDAYVMVLNDRTLTNTLPAPPQSVSARATNFAVGLRHRF